MSLFGRALAGAGQAGVEIANKYIDEDMAKQRAQFMADLQHQNMVKEDEYKLSAPRQGALQQAEGGMTSARLSATNTANTSATIANSANPALQSALDQDSSNKSARDASADVAKMRAAAPAKLEIEMANAQAERDRVAKLAGGASGVALVDKLMAAGDFTSAIAVGKAMTSGDRNVGYGGAVIGPDGKVIFDGSQLRADAKGGAVKVDHFDAKQWDEGRKPDKEWFKVDDGAGPKYVPQLSMAFNSRFSELHQSGAMSPEQARSDAYNFSVGVQSRAEALMNSDEGKNKKLSIGAAADLVLRRLKEAPPEPKPPVPPPAPSAPGILSRMFSENSQSPDRVAYERGGGLQREAESEQRAAAARTAAEELARRKAQAAADPEIAALQAKAQRASAAGDRDLVIKLGDEIGALSKQRYSL